MDKYNLQRFVEAQEQRYDKALQEIRNGRKWRHWMWYIFPQLRGLGYSPNCEYYGISGLDETREYLQHPILGNRLREISEALLTHNDKSADDILGGGVDSLKVCSSMTLFDAVSPNDVFQKVIDKYYNGNKDMLTLKMLGVKPKNAGIIGAIIGDIVGSRFEFMEECKSTDFWLFTELSDFTDDTVMTVAVADWLLNGRDLVESMRDWGRRYRYRGYGGMFQSWLLFRTDPQPYGSYGNGSGMRVSPVGFYAQSLEEALDLAKQSAEVTHNHPEGIKGAQAIASAIYLARTGKSKDYIREYIRCTFEYDLYRTCDEIRPNYYFNETCQGSCPEAIIAFLESNSYESAIRLAVSLGGDTDTIACMAGGIAAAYYGIPDRLVERALTYLPEDMLEIIRKFDNIEIEEKKQLTTPTFNKRKH